ncbi:MAG: hypothetical protein H0V84_03895 [Actinobacteria bacterium]|nr:hypothetical protein [Actinomycetota bacterium]
MIRRFLLVAAIATSALVVAGQIGAMSAPKLNGTVGPGFTISLKDSTGKKVTRLKPGKYTFAINDKSAIHDFNLEKGSIHKKLTGVRFKGKKNVTVTLATGTWKFYCDPHETSMMGTFKVAA